eukprot:424230-Pelagomonas_calceolata.AAC.1
MPADFMPLTTSAISVASGADIRPDWHAFGMLVAWIGAGIVTLLYYIWVSCAEVQCTGVEDCFWKEANVCYT